MDLRKGLFVLKILKKNYKEICLQLCSLRNLHPNVVFPRERHTQDGLMICGGQYDVNCLKMKDNGEWQVTHNLTTKRYKHI